MSPRTIITGQLLDYHKHCRYEFGEYVQTHEEHDNSLLSRTVGAIALRPTGNQQGGYFFMSLHTGQIINRLHATKLPMPSEAIMRVEQLAKAQNMMPSLAFGNRDNWIIMQDINDDEDTADAYIPIDEADSTLYYDQEMSMTQTGDNDRTNDIEENNNASHSDIPTNMIQMDDTGTVSTVTNKMTTPTDTENDPATPLSEIDEEDDQNSAIQSMEEDIETSMNTSHEESSQGEKQQSTTPATVENIAENTVDRAVDEEMDAKYGARSTRCDRIPSTTPGAEPPRDARDSGSARSHSTHLETSSSNRP